MAVVTPPEAADMECGAAIFCADYSIGPVELGRALEERGFESL